MCGAEPAGVVANPIRTDEKPGQGDRRAVERQATTQLTTLTSLLAGFGFLWFTSLVDKGASYAVFARCPRRDGVDDLCARARFDCRSATDHRFRNRHTRGATPPGRSPLGRSHEKRNLIVPDLDWVTALPS